jgi:hypothetical protein
MRAKGMEEVSLTLRLNVKSFDDKMSNRCHHVGSFKIDIFMDFNLILRKSPL